MGAAVIFPTSESNRRALSLNCCSKAAAMPPTADTTRMGEAEYFMTFF